MKTAVPLLLLVLVACSSSKPVEPSDESFLIEVAELGDTPGVTRAGNLWFTGQPPEDAWPAIMDAGITRVIDLRDRDEERGYDQATKMRELGLEYEVFEVRASNYAPSVVEPAIEAIRTAFESGEPTLVHCSSSNRVGAIIAIWRYRQGAELERAMQLGAAAGMAGAETQAREYLAQNP